MQRSARAFSVALGAAALALGFPGFASAKDSVPAPDTEQVKAEISLNHFNLGNAADAKRLYARIEHAAYNLCSVNSGPSARALQLQRECAQQAINDAVHDVDHPNLTAVYLERAGKRSMVASSR